MAVLRLLPLIEMSSFYEKVIVENWNISTIKCYSLVF